MINVIDSALDKCQRAKLVLKGYEIQKETNIIEQNDEELAIRIIAEYLDQAIESLSSSSHLSGEKESAILTTLKNRKHNTNPQNTFAERLKFALKEQGMTQGVLADWTGISQSTISSMATGKIKNIDTPRAEAIAKALDVSFVWLMHGEGGIYDAQPESLKLQAARLKFSSHNIEV